MSSTPSANHDAPRGDVALHGLEVEVASGWSLNVSPGELLATTPSPGTDGRPAEWSGRVEADDAPAGLYALPVAATVAPASPPSGALVSAEIWAVYVSPSEVAAEVTSALKQFNETTGVFDTVYNKPKVYQHQAAPKVLRGASGGAVPSLPLGTDVPLAFVWVPPGATDLSGAVILDTRRAPTDLDLPNEIGGSWECPLAPATALPDSSSIPIWRGHVWARLGGERLTAISRGMRLAQIAEPGATWDNTAAISAPATAYLYLCRVAGRVPRPTRRGATVLGAIGAGIPTWLEGALVLSPTPPRVRCPVGGSSEAGGRWDLRASASIALPDGTSVFGASPGAVAYPWGGLTAPADDCICVGIMQYVGIDTFGPPDALGADDGDAGWLDRGRYLLARRRGLPRRPDGQRRRG